MQKGWTTTKLIAAGSFGVLAFVLALFEAGIVAATGFALAGGVLGALLEPAIRLLCCHVIDRFGSATIMGLILGLLAIPIAFQGPPGFVPKVITQLIGGIGTDLMYLLLKRKKILASAVIGGVNRIIYLLLILQIGRWFGMPGIEEAAAAFTSPIVVG
ncbi:MAG: hypothetical protein JXB38_15280, partial [Anaerolineales bacterium]|nr:hypothetical protein [Anaerolineales bacterium]